MTAAALAVMVLRQAASRHVPDLDQGTPTYTAAERVVRAARTTVPVGPPSEPAGIRPVRRNGSRRLDGRRSRFARSPAALGRLGRPRVRRGLPASTLLPAVAVAVAVAVAAG